MTRRLTAPQIVADVGFLLARLLLGIGSYALLAVAVAAAVLGMLAVGVLTIWVLPALAVASLLVLAVAVPLGWRFPRVRRWLDGHPFRRRIGTTAAFAVQAFALLVGGWLLACRAAARRERTQLAAFRGAAIPVDYRPLPEGRVRMLRVLVSDPATWRDLTYLAVMPLYALVACGLVVAAWVGGLALLAQEQSPDRTARLWHELGVAARWDDPLLWLTIAAAVGALVLAPLATRALAYGGATLGTTLLATGEGARIRAELDEQRLRRQLAVDAAEQERRRIERDLHDGAQQRLVALGMGLGLARETMRTDPVAAAALVDEAHAEAKLALAELRDLARGIHPAILGDRGLDAALSDLVRRSRVPVSTLVSLPHRPPTTVESAAYFIVAESLTNISRHAAATRATVTITHVDDTVVVEVIDDGVGGADPARGTGLRGLTDRVTALGGRFSVSSPGDGPTTVRAELPCAS